MWSFSHLRLFFGPGPMLKIVMELLKAPHLHLLPWLKHGWTSWTSQVLWITYKSEWSSSVNTSRPQANKHQADLSNRNLLKTAVSNIQTKEVDRCSISVPSALMLPAVTEAELSCYPDDPTTRKTQTDHIRHTANKELLLHCYTMKAKQ